MRVLLNMRISNFERVDICSYVQKQLCNFFPSRVEERCKLNISYIELAFDRVEYCFSAIKRKYYQVDGVPVFNLFNSDHYAIFLYYLSNTVYQREGDSELASKIFLLNKALHGIDAFYSIKLPDIFYFVHPLGTVLGNAAYENYFVVYQNCSVGAKHGGGYPVFSEGTVLYEKSSVIGDCRFGRNVIIGSNSSIIDGDLADNSLLVGVYPKHRILENKLNVIQNIFG
jgi:serine O-acetyltransferase